MGSMVTIPKIKYEELKEQARAYEVLERAMSRGGFFDIPLTRKSAKILDAFRKTGRYNKKFLESLKKGLSRSDYFL